MQSELLKVILLAIVYNLLTSIRMELIIRKQNKQIKILSRLALENIKADCISREYYQGAKEAQDLINELKNKP